MIESNDTKHETFEKKRKPHSNKIVFMEKQISDKQLLPLHFLCTVCVHWDNGHQWLK